MMMCILNARTLASEASIEDLMMQGRKIGYDVSGLTETSLCPRQHELSHEVRFVREANDPNRTSTTEEMSINPGLDSLRRLRSNIQLQRRRDRGLLYGHEEVLQGRPHILLVQNTLLVLGQDVSTYSTWEPWCNGIAVGQTETSTFRRFFFDISWTLGGDFLKTEFWKQHPPQYLLQLTTSENCGRPVRKTLKMLKNAFSTPKLFTKICFRELVQILINSMGNK
ncbi:hypothetical protein Y032_0159g3274 [Ancylostoma ceylanicum]|nr:hypothetical protein Y032_0159g3274 [Ancylostoma ceylanicum]